MSHLALYFEVQGEPPGSKLPNAMCVLSVNAVDQKLYYTVKDGKKEKILLDIPFPSVVSCQASPSQHDIFTLKYHGTGKEKATIYSFTQALVGGGGIKGKERDALCNLIQGVREGFFNEAAARYAFGSPPLLKCNVKKKSGLINKDDRFLILSKYAVIIKRSQDAAFPLNVMLLGCIKTEEAGKDILQVYMEGSPESVKPPVKTRARTVEIIFGSREERDEWSQQLEMASEVMKSGPVLTIEQLRDCVRAPVITAKSPASRRNSTGPRRTSAGPNSNAATNAQSAIKSVETENETKGGPESLMSVDEGDETGMPPAAPEDDDPLPPPPDIDDDDDNDNDVSAPLSARGDDGNAGDDHHNNDDDGSERPPQPIQPVPGKTYPHIEADGETNKNVKRVGVPSNVFLSTGCWLGDDGYVYLDGSIVGQLMLDVTIPILSSKQYAGQRLYLNRIAPVAGILPPGLILGSDCNVYDSNWECIGSLNDATSDADEEDGAEAATGPPDLTHQSSTGSLMNSTSFGETFPDLFAEDDPDHNAVPIDLEDLNATLVSSDSSDQQNAIQLPPRCMLASDYYVYQADGTVVGQLQPDVKLPVRDDQGRCLHRILPTRDAGLPPGLVIASNGLVYNAQFEPVGSLVAPEEEQTQVTTTSSTPSSSSSSSLSSSLSSSSTATMSTSNDISSGKEHRKRSVGPSVPDFAADGFSVENEDALNDSYDSDDDDDIGAPPLPGAPPSVHAKAHGSANVGTNHISDKPSSSSNAPETDWSHLTPLDPNVSRQIVMKSSSNSVTAGDELLVVVKLLPPAYVLPTSGSIKDDSKSHTTETISSPSTSTSTTSTSPLDKVQLDATVIGCISVTPSSMLTDVRKQIKLDLVSAPPAFSFINPIAANNTKQLAAPHTSGGVLFAPVGLGQEARTKALMIAVEDNEDVLSRALKDGYPTKPLKSQQRKSDTQLCIILKPAPMQLTVQAALSSSAALGALPSHMHNITVLLEGSSEPLGMVNIAALFLEEGAVPSFSDLRDLITEELDDVPADFVFLMDGVKVARKQEQKRPILSLQSPSVTLRNMTASPLPSPPQPLLSIPPPPGFSSNPSGGPPGSGLFLPPPPGASSGLPPPPSDTSFLPPPPSHFQIKLSTSSSSTLPSSNADSSTSTSSANRGDLLAQIRGFGTTGLKKAGTSTLATKSPTKPASHGSASRLLNMRERLEQQLKARREAVCDDQNDDDW